MKAKPWHSVGMTPEKDKRMIMNKENFDRVIAMRDELIFEMRQEISKLKTKINKLEQKAVKHDRQNN